MKKQNEKSKLGINEYKVKIQDRYVDFYIKDIGILSSYENMLNNAIQSDFEKDIFAIRRLLQDVFNLEYAE